MNQQPIQSQVKYQPAFQPPPIYVQQQEEKPKGERKFTNYFLIFSIIYLIIIFFLTFMIYSSLHGHGELTDKYYKTVVTATKGNLASSKNLQSYSASKCPLKNVNKVDSIRKYREDEHTADFIFCYIILILCVLTFFIWIAVFTSKGKLGGLNSKGAHAFVVFLFFLIIAANITYFIFFMSEGEDHIENLEQISSNFDTLLNDKCYKMSVSEGIALDYIHEYVQTIIHCIRPLVIVNFIISCIYFLIWMGLLGVANSKKSLCHPL